ncbi:MAG TPA: Rnf-Nqr domain containing protein [Pseudohongiella sp.]|nr:Rnf-Nqr domain containing protein [Pseudohongiella sp.]
MNSVNRQSLTVLLLAPLVAASSTSGLALFLGAGSAVVLLAATALLYLLQRFVFDTQADADGSLPGFALLMLVLSSVTTLLILLSQRWFYEAYLLTGIWLPLISANLLVVRQLMLVDNTRPFLPTMLDALRTGIMMILALTAFALCRELLTGGRILLNMHLFTDIPARGIEVFEGWPRLKLFEMAPGALLLLALILAGKRLWQSRHSAPPAPAGAPENSLRVRVTGKIS